MGLVSFFFFFLNRERIIMGFTLFQRLGKIQEWRDLMLLS